MTATINGSTYPPAVTALLPQASALAEQLGELPSRNRLKTELRIGSPKANAVLDALRHRRTEPSDGVPAVAPAGTDQPDPAASGERAAPAMSAHSTGVVDPGTAAAIPASEVVVPPVVVPIRIRSWPVLLLALPAFVAIWSGWVGLGGLTGFGVVHPLPGIADGFAINSAITLPIGVETYAAYALRAWLTPAAPVQARRFAKYSAIGALLLGAAGQVAYHIMAAAHVTHAPVAVTTVVACLPVAVLGMGAALAHLLHQPTT